MLDLPAAQRQHLVRRAIVPFPAAVPTPVVGDAVAIALAICLIVFSIVSDEVVQAEAVMSGYEVDALVRPVHIARAVGKQIVAAVQSLHQRAHHVGIAFDERPQVIAEFSVPLLPRQAGKTPTQQIRADIPRLGHQTQVKRHA